MLVITLAQRVGYRTQTQLKGQGMIKIFLDRANLSHYYFMAMDC
jgi:hypothetical protein